MKSYSLFSVAALALAAASAPLSSRQTTCETGFYIIGARASEEQPDASLGATGPTATQIQAAIAGTTTLGLTYPAWFLPIFYTISESTGVTNLRNDIAAHLAACPSAQIVLLGYSQGAQVVMDVLGGAGASGAGALSDAQIARVAAAVVYGDPSFTAGQSYNVGTNTARNGGSPRGAASLANIARIGERVRSYCDTGDPFCAGGLNSSVHTSYNDRYAAAGAAFAVAQFGRV